MNESTLKLIQYAQTQLPSKPKLAPWISIVDIGDNRLHLRGAELIVPLIHPLFVETFYKVKPLLDGDHSVEQIMSEGGGEILPTTIEFLLKMLRANGILQEGNKTIEVENTCEVDNLRQFFSHYTQNPDGMILNLTKTRLGIIGKGKLKNSIINAASHNQIHNIVEFSIDEIENSDLEAKIKETNFIIACSENPDYSFFNSINNLCLKTGTRWIRVAMEGTSAIIGPTIIPYQTACFHCYIKRVLSNSTDPEGFIAYQKYFQSKEIPKNEGILPSSLILVANESILEIIRIITGFVPPITLGRLLYIKPDFTRNQHEVFRLPRCPACRPQKAYQEIWNLDSLIKNEQP